MTPELTWGVTGLFFEQPYMEASTDLVDVTGRLADALNSVVANLNACADDYDQADTETAGSFNPFANDIGMVS